jgi:SAM-dependent methyltransferase
MTSSVLLSIVRCPDCHGRLSGDAASLTCETCGRQYASGPDYVDLRPKQGFDDTTKYVDDALHADHRQDTVSPPVLGASLRNTMLRRFLRPASGDRLIDLGCGSGRALVWNRDAGAYGVGVDVSPFFAREARQQVDLVLADLRRLPFADGSFTKASMLDVVEHLSPESLQAVMREAARVLAPGGSLFVYSHVRRNSRLALGLRAINRLARRLERRGWIDLTQERLRKSDHVNPLADLDELRALIRSTGFQLAKIRFYTPLVGAFIENILVRVGEGRLARRAAREALAAAAGPGGRAASIETARTARTMAKERIARRGPTYAALRVLTWMMSIDLILFGRVPTGPFFALLTKKPPAGAGT